MREGSDEIVLVRDRIEELSDLLLEMRTALVGLIEAIGRAAPLLEELDGSLPEEGLSACTCEVREERGEDDGRLFLVYDGSGACPVHPKGARIDVTSAEERSEE